MDSDRCPCCFSRWEVVSVIEYSPPAVVATSQVCAPITSVCSQLSTNPSLFRGASPCRLPPGSGGAAPECLGQGLLLNFYCQPHAVQSSYRKLNLPLQFCKFLLGSRREGCSQTLKTRAIPFPCVQWGAVTKGALRHALDIMAFRGSQNECSKVSQCDSRKKDKL